MRTQRKVFITVKTNPLPSAKYREIVCTAGIDADGNFIRLYPFPFRSMEHYTKFHKYQWIEVDIDKNPNDPRPESYKAYPNSLIVGEHITSWSTRKNIVLGRANQTMCQLTKETGRLNNSLAIIKPKSVTDFLIKETERNWSQKEKLALQQDWLFPSSGPPLKKMPYEFKYKYFCQQENCKGHTQTVEDWELSALYWNLIHKGETEASALEKVKNKFFNVFCSNKHDTHFFVGTHSSYPSWLIIGIFYPPNLFPSSVKGQQTFWSQLGK